MNSIQLAVAVGSSSKQLVVGGWNPTEGVASIVFL
jgi:hypothetical protein